MLTTTNEYSNVFLAKKRLLLDSCILNDLATDQRTSDILHRANAIYSFIYSTVSLLEVGFGPVGKADIRQNNLASKIYQDAGVINMDTEEFLAQERQQTSDPPKAVFSHTPGRHEWYAARYILIQAMNISIIEGKRARNLRNDAIIYSSAWNTRSALITNDASDFEVFNRVNTNRNPKHLLPIFSLDDLEQSLSENVSFPKEKA